MGCDNICKFLCEHFPERYAAWRVKDFVTPIQVLKKELSNEPIRADSVILLQAQDRILHLEFQVNVEKSSPPIPLRMLDYWVRLHRQYRLPVDQTVILLKESPAARELKPEFTFGKTFHPFQIVRLWEENPESLLQDSALFPLATLTKTHEPEKLLHRVAEQIKKIDNIDDRKLISDCAQILAGLRFKTELIRQTFKEVTMRDSVIYKEILEEGMQKGRSEGHRAGLLEGEQKGRQEGRQEGRIEGQLAIIVRFLQRKFDISDPILHEQLQMLSPSQLEELADALFEFKGINDFNVWLQNNLSK